MKALIIVDAQNDFCQGGSLEVKNSNSIFPFINNLIKEEEFTKIFITKDWHPKDHSSFAINNGLKPFQTKFDSNGEIEYVWPVHCAQYTKGAELSPLLDFSDKSYIEIRKGYIKDQECYSGFGTKRNPTKLLKLLKRNNIEEVIVVGLALDFCVGSTALDAKREGFKVTVVAEATKAVNDQTAQLMIETFADKGIAYTSFYKMSEGSVHTIQSSDQSSSEN